WYEVVPVFQIVLQFVTSPEAERETFVNSPVVLRVPPELDLIKIDSARARSPPESRGPSRAETLEAGEDESAVLIAEIGRVVTRRFKLKARAHAVFFERQVDVVGEFKLARAARTGDLRAAARERAQDLDGGHVRQRRDLHVLPDRLKTNLVEELFADRAGIGEAQYVFGRIGRVPPLREIEIAHAVVVAPRGVALIFDARGVGRRQQVFDARVQIERSPWLPDRVVEKAVGQGRVDSFRLV